MSLLDTFVMVFQADATAALRAIADLADQNDSLEESARKSREALDKQLKALEDQAATVGMTKAEITLYRLAQEGATSADLERAAAALRASGAIGDTTSVTDKAKAAIEAQIKALEDQAATYGMSSGEATLYRMAQQGASEADIERARAALVASGAIEDAASEARKARQSIDGQIDALEEQAKTYGMSSGEATLYRLAQQGATEADLERARAALEATGAMKKEESAVAGLAGKLVGFAAASFSVGAIITGAFGRAENIRAIEQTSDALGIAIGDVDAFGKAAEAMGGDAEGARDSLTDMSEAMGEALADKESGRAEAFKKLGISIADANGKAKDGLTGMLDLAKAVEGMSRSEAIFKIKEIGITDNRTVEMVLKGRQELERMLKVQKEQGVISKESAENARKLTEAMGSLKNGLASAGNGFIDSIIPAITKVIEWLGKGVAWMRDNKDFVLGFFAAVAAVVLAVYAPAMWAAASATIAATWPLIAIGAAIAAAAAAFAILYDDVMNFVEGNDSFIGQVSEKYPIVGQIVHGLVDAFKAMWDMLITGAAQIGTFVSNAFMQVVDGIKYAIDFMVEAYGRIQTFTTSVVAAFQAMGDGIAAVFSFIVEAVKSSLSFVSAGLEKLKSGVSGVASFFGMGDEGSESGSMAEVMDSANQQIAAAAASPTNSISSNAISNSTNKTSNEVNVGQITVQTQATDAQGVAKGVGSELKGQLKDLEHQSSTGVAR